MMKVLLLMSLMLLACSDDETVNSTPQVTNKPQESNAGTVAKNTATLPSKFETPVNQYFYNPAGKRDPFKSYVPDVVKGSKITRTPLELYGLDDLILTGIIWGLSDPRALIKAPDGYSYIVRADTKIGVNRGRISKITKKSIFVEEEYRDPSGKLLVRESKMNLRIKEGGSNEDQLSVKYVED